MAFSQEDLQALAGFVSEEVGKGIAALKNELKSAPAPDRTSIVGAPDVPADAGPEFYIHLADGTVLQTHDSQSTHMDVNGTQVQVIGRYQIGA